MIRKDSELILVFCSHGSKSKEFMTSFLSFFRKMKKKFDIEMKYCFIEINKPLIDFVLETSCKNYKLVIFIPALIFKGKHYKTDVKKKLDEISLKLKKKIIFIKNLNLNNELISIFKSKINEEVFDPKKSILLTCASFTKEKNNVKILRQYSKKLSIALKIEKFNCFLFGNESKIISNLEKELKTGNLNFIILHPIFLFDGFLYNKLVSKFKEVFNSRLFVTPPLLDERKVFDIFYSKIQNKLTLFE